MASWTTLFILKRIGNWKTSSFSFSKRAIFIFQTTITRRILKKVILSWNQKWFHQIESQFFWNHFGFTRYFQLLGGIFFFLTWFQRRKIAVFWPKFTISKVSSFNPKNTWNHQNRRASFTETGTKKNERFPFKTLHEKESIKIT